MTFEEYWWIGVCANPNMARDALLKQIAESAWNAGAKDEREACAKLAETMAIAGPLDETHGKYEVAQAIRMRSNGKSDRLAEDKGA